MIPDEKKLNQLVAALLPDLDAEQTHRVAVREKHLRRAPTAQAAPVAGTFRCRVDVYNGPRGRGYAVVFDYEVAGQWWMKCVARGPEAFRSHDWKMVRKPN